MISLNLKFIDEYNYIDEVKIIKDPNNLIKFSKYFSSLLSNNFKESKQNKFDIDLTNLKYLNKKEHLNIFFKIAFDNEIYDFKPILGNREIVLKLSSLCKQKVVDYYASINFGLGSDISISDYFIFIELSEFFMIDKMKNLIESSLERYYKFIEIYSSCSKNFIDNSSDEEGFNDEEDLDEGKWESDDGSILDNIGFSGEEDLGEGKLDDDSILDEAVFGEEDTDEQYEEYLVEEDLVEECNMKKDIDEQCEDLSEGYNEKCSTEDHETIVNKYLDKTKLSEIKTIKKNFVGVDNEKKINLIETLNEHIYLKLNSKIIINHTELNDELNQVKLIWMLNQFSENYYYIYLSFKLLNKNKIFIKLVKFFKKLKNKIYIKKNTFKYLNYDPILPQLSIDEIKFMPLEDFYNLFILLKKFINLEFFFLKVYDYYDIMNFENHNWEVFMYNQKNYQYQIGIKTIKSEEKFKETFNEMTNNIFMDMNWDNLIIAGGFIYGIINNLQDSIIKSTDIDLFLYGTSNEIENKIKYLLNYFNKFNPFYIRRGYVINLLIKSLNYDIQLINTRKLSSVEIIKDFDLSYVSIFYDGIDVITNIEGLVSLKYGISIFNELKIKENQSVNNELNITDLRLYKTYLKGLHIKKTKLIKNNKVKEVIDIKEIENNKNLLLNLNKSNLVRKLIELCETDEANQLIGTYYRSKFVTINLEDFLNYKEQIFSKIEYDNCQFKKNIRQLNINDFKKDSNQLNIEEFKKLKYNVKMINISILSIKCTNKEIIHEIYIETDYHPFRILFKEKELVTLNFNEKDIIFQKLIHLDNKISKLGKHFYKHKAKGKFYDLSLFTNQFKKDRKLININLDKKSIKYDKLKNKLEQIKKKQDPINDKMKVIFKTRIWIDSHKRHGIKYILESFSIKRTRDVIKM